MRRGNPEIAERYADRKWPVKIEEKPFEGIFEGLVELPKARRPQVGDRVKIMEPDSIYYGVETRVVYGMGAAFCPVRHPGGYEYAERFEWHFLELLP